MEKKNSCARARFSTILWGILAILLCAAPCVWAVTFNDGLEHDIDYKILGDFLQVDNAKVNLLPGAYIEWYLTANDGSTVNIKGGTEDGTVGMWISVNLGSNVTVYGTSFKIGDVPHYAGEDLFISATHPDHLGPLTVVYENGQQVDLPIDCCYETGEGGAIINYATVTLAVPDNGVKEVAIDIKPGSYPNTINLGSNGVVPVAILSGPDFDATTVDPESVSLAGSGVAVRGKGNKYMAHEEDVNGDGLMDLVVKVETQNLDPDTFQDGSAILTGETVDGVQFEGSDEIIIVPPDG